MIYVNRPNEFCKVIRKFPVIEIVESSLRFGSRNQKTVVRSGKNLSYFIERLMVIWAINNLNGFGLFYG